MAMYGTYIMIHGLGVVQALRGGRMLTILGIIIVGISARAGTSLGAGITDGGIIRIGDGVVLSIGDGIVHTLILTILVVAIGLMAVALVIVIHQALVAVTEYLPTDVVVV